MRKYAKMTQNGSCLLIITLSLTHGAKEREIEIERECVRERERGGGGIDN